MIYKLRSVQNTGTCYPGQGWFVDRPPRLGEHVPVFCRDLNLFYSIHFPSFYSSVGLVGKFAGLPVCTVPSAIFHCSQNEAGHQKIKAPRMPCWGVAAPSKHSLPFMSQPGEIDIKWMKSVSMRSFQRKNQVNGESFAYLRVSLLYFSLESRLIPAVVELGNVRLCWKLIRSRIWQLSHSCQTGVWEYFPSSLALN